MFFVTAPLHTLAIFQGTQDSWKILFAAKDASRWASFDSINAITTAKLWVLTMMVMLSSSVVVGLVRIGTAKKPFDEIERWLGVVMSFVFLSLTAVPSAAMFFHKRVTSCVEIKIRGAFVLNHRVDLHAIDATPARWRGDAGSSPLDGAGTAASSPRNDVVKNYRVHPTHWLIST